VFAAFGPPAINASGAVAFARWRGQGVPGGIFVRAATDPDACGRRAETPIGGIFAKFSDASA